jgi:hypothetical protein
MITEPTAQAQRIELRIIVSVDVARAARVARGQGFDAPDVVALVRDEIVSHLQDQDYFARRT